MFTFDCQLFVYLWFDRPPLFYAGPLPRRPLKSSVIMNELDQLRAEAEQLKNAIRVRLNFPCLYFEENLQIPIIYFGEGIASLLVFKQKLVLFLKGEIIFLEIL